ncbi:single-stranded DNA-binding protein [Salipiger pacificus]|nr:single-stranded DNA-binding protein [Alloyangia pacifica]
MRTFAEFQIIGRVGKIKEVGPTLRVSIAAEYGRKDDRGDLQSRPFWNEVTIFKDSVIGWAKENIAPGDVVHTRGTMRQSEYTKNGQTVYDVTFAANDFDLLRKKASEG